MINNIFVNYSLTTLPPRCQISSEHCSVHIHSKTWSGLYVWKSVFKQIDEPSNATDYMSERGFIWKAREKIVFISKDKRILDPKKKKKRIYKTHLSAQRLNLELTSGLFCQHFIKGQKCIQQDNHCTDKATFSGQGLFLFDHKLQR